MPKDIGATLKECRIQAKMSVKEISDILTKKGFKASEKTVYSWENGYSSPSPDVLLNMCQAYGVDDVLATFGYDGYDEDGKIILNLPEQEIIEKYRSLDRYGKEVVNLVVDKEYERCQDQREGSQVIQLPDPSMPEAAHERTDIKVTGEDIKYDDDIMADDKEWE